MKMTIDTNIHAFNTGRQYTAYGQRIAWQVISHHEDDLFGDEICVVAFTDIDRGIDGTVKVIALRDMLTGKVEQITDADVLRAYDNGGYGSIYSWFSDRELADSLARAAASL